ncbi:TetR/AcrR family transcriptional regulator [Methanobacterium alcaliphilum]|uniref:TetR/AcrR family transcriptional regulator n=1 Tax=Methanobacterium alcaliphilum TaxID=392018 RepID=UPI00200B79F4|nr:TetR/AcrR family transcriptional regulator [Methanobacterium alcaliphilum]MCK9151869.1 TetR/AcrR family transcriptional regulator [Methanobacterium alcaliphilum]
MAISNRKKKERKRKTNEIIDAAENHFFKKGYEKTTMEEIANALELTKPALYRYFQSKEDLFFAVVHRGSEILSTMMKEEAESQDIGLEKILATGYAYWKFYNQYPDYCRVMLEARNIYPESLEAHYVQKIREHGQDYLGVMCDAISVGKKDGSVRDDINTFLTALFLVESTIAILKSSEATSDVLNLIGMGEEDLIKHSLDLMSHAISKMPILPDDKHSQRQLFK